MEKDQIIILEKRGLISITGEDAKEFLQNIITNDINKVSKASSVFAALLSPQGKYLFDFFVIKKNEGYLLDCNGNTVSVRTSGYANFADDTLPSGNGSIVGIFTIYNSEKQFEVNGYILYLRIKNLFKFKALIVK